MFQIIGNDGTELFRGNYAEVTYWVSMNGLEGVSRIIAI